MQKGKFTPYLLQFLQNTRAHEMPQARVLKKLILLFIQNYQKCTNLNATNSNPCCLQVMQVTYLQVTIKLDGIKRKFIISA